MKNAALASFVFCIWALFSLQVDAQTARRSNCVYYPQTVQQISSTYVQPTNPVVFRKFSYVSHQPVINQNVGQSVPVYSAPVDQVILQQSPAVPSTVVYDQSTVIAPCNDCGCEICECELQLNTTQYQKDQLDLQLKDSEKNVVGLGGHINTLGVQVDSLDKYNGELKGQLKKQTDKLEDRIATRETDLEERVEQAEKQASIYFWLFLAFAILSGLLLLSLLWLLSRLAKSRAEANSLSADLRRIEPELQAAQANLSNAQQNLQAAERERNGFDSQLQACRIQVISLQERVTHSHHNGHHHNGCCDRNGTFIYNPHHPHREGESPMAVPTTVPTTATPTTPTPTTTTPTTPTPTTTTPTTPTPTTTTPSTPTPTTTTPTTPTPTTTTPTPTTATPSTPTAQSPQSPTTQAQPQNPQSTAPTAPVSSPGGSPAAGPASSGPAAGPSAPAAGGGPGGAAAGGGGAGGGGGGAPPV